MKWNQKDTTSWQTDNECFAIIQLSQGHTATILNQNKRYQLLWHNGVEWAVLAYFSTTPENIFIVANEKLDLLRKEINE